MTALVALVLLGAALAWWSAARTHDASDYFAAGRRAGPWLVGVAGTAAGVSAFTFVGGPGLFAAVGVGSLWIILSAPLTGALQCWALGERATALAGASGAVTVPELLACRFGRPARGAAALVILIGCVASLAVQVRAAAVLGEDLLHVGGAAAAGAAMLATVAYTAVGGMRAGLVADAVQGAVMAAVAIVIAVAALATAGGPTAAVAAIEAARPELLGTFGRVEPSRALAWYMLFALGTLAQPHYVQKFLFLRSRRALRTLPAVLTLALAVMLTVWLGVGLAGSSLMARGAFSLGRPDDLTPTMLVRLGPWAMLLAGVAILAALMSTAASLLNLAAAAVARDLPAALGRAPAGLPVARVATVIAAAAALAVGLASERAVALLGVAGWGFFTAALLPCLVVGLAWRGATTGGVAAAMLAGAGVDLALEPLRAHLSAGLEPGLAGAAVGTLVLVATSLLAPRAASAQAGASSSARYDARRAIED